jgi:hypothetical protein
MASRRKKTTKRRRRWTAAELADLKRFARRRARGDRSAPPVSTWADRHNRTEGATRQKAFELGLSMTG